MCIRKKKQEPQSKLNTLYKIISQCITEVNIKYNDIKLLQENVGQNL